MGKPKSKSRPKKEEKSRLRGQSQEEIIAAGKRKHGQFLQKIFIIFYKSINGGG